MNIGFLASGGLGLISCRALVEHGILPCFIFTDRNSRELIQFARQKRIPIFLGNPRNGKGKSFLTDQPTSVDLIVSINYLFLLDDELIRFPAKGCINIHGSLLPKYRGRTPHVWAIINNEQTTGATVHFIDGGCDTGPLILQEAFPIESGFTGGSILEIFGQLYPRLLLKSINMFLNGIPSAKMQDEKLATFFGKRSPDDGKINWDWQRERIYNWVRAQASPYPGAFTYYEGRKVTVDEVSYSERGFHYEIENGYVLAGGEYPEIKTPNGVLRILKKRDALILAEGKVLH